MVVSRSAAHRSQRGVALVVTLIMLAIITFMAVTFLVLSQRERSAVTGTTDTKIARNASDTALARVCTELLTHVMLQTNYQDFDFTVSTNYISPLGFLTGIHSPTNVNYEYLNDSAHDHAPITTVADRNQNIANLEFNPRPPVYVVTNILNNAGEFRYYLDLNRNGRDDRNGNWPVVVVSNGVPKYLTTNGTAVSTNLPIGGSLLTNTLVGDPDWIGILERPQETHSADNRFIARYAYVVVPIGKALDLIPSTTSR